MAVRLRLKRMGRRNRSFYRVVAADSRNPRDGVVIEELGWYDPNAKQQDKQLELKTDRVQHWLSQGALPSETVASLIKRAGSAATDNAG